jgi:hypothetical protein
MVLEVLDTKSLAGFRPDVFTALTHYYEEVRKIPFAGGSPKPKSFKRKFAAPFAPQAPPAAGEDPPQPGSGEKDYEEESAAEDPPPDAAAAAAETGNDKWYAKAKPQRINDL